MQVARDKEGKQWIGRGIRLPRLRGKRSVVQRDGSSNGLLDSCAMVAADDLARLTASETDRIEWKQSTNQRDALLQAACALANDLGNAGTPGYLVIGIEKNGHVRGIEPEGDIDEQQQALANRLRSSLLQPTPSASIADFSIAGKTVLVVEIAPYPVPPVVEFNGHAFVRIGTTTHRATHADRMRLNERRPANRLPFDTRPHADATLDDLDLRAARLQYDDTRELDEDAQSFPSFEAWLAQKQYGALRDGVLTPNAASVLDHRQEPARPPASSVGRPGAIWRLGSRRRGRVAPQRDGDPGGSAGGRLELAGSTDRERAG
jgi:hypothetical protein